MRPFTILVLLVCTYAFWIRRSTWGSKWDGAITLGLLLRGCDMLCQTPVVGRVVGPILHRVTGLWNFEDFIGHLLYLGGAGCIYCMAVSRLKLTDQQRRRMLRTGIELPAILVTALGTVTFAYGIPDENIPDLAHGRPNAMMCMYAFLMISAVLYLSANSIWALLIISRNPASRRTARVYIGACGVSIIACFVGVLDIALGFADTTWVTVRVELLVYAGAAIYSWNRRKQGLAGKKLEPA